MTPPREPVAVGQKRQVPHGAVVRVKTIAHGYTQVQYPSGRHHSYPTSEIERWPLVSNAE